MHGSNILHKMGPGFLQFVQGLKDFKEQSSVSCTQWGKKPASPKSFILQWKDRYQCGHQEHLRWLRALALAPAYFWKGSTDLYSLRCVGKKSSHESVGHMQMLMHFFFLSETSVSPQSFHDWLRPLMSPVTARYCKYSRDSLISCACVT